MKNEDVEGRLLGYALVGIGVALSLASKVGALKAIGYGLFWPAWLGYQLATRLGA